MQNNWVEEEAEEIPVRISTTPILERHPHVLYGL